MRNFLTPILIDIGGFALYGYSKRVLKKFNDFYPCKVKKFSNKELQTISTEIINESRTCLCYLIKLRTEIRCIVYKNQEAKI